MIDWLNEPWVKLYTRCDPAWQRLPVSARGLGSELLKYADAVGVVALVEEGEPAGAAVARLVAARAGELERVVDDVAWLLRDGFLIQDGERLVIRNFELAQERRSPAAIRQARHRQRSKLASNQQEFFDRNASVTRGGHALSQGDETRRVETKRNETNRRDPTRDLLDDEARMLGDQAAQARDVMADPTLQPFKQLAEQLFVKLCHVQPVPYRWVEALALVVGFGKEQGIDPPTAAGQLFAAFDQWASTCSRSPPMTPDGFVRNFSHVRRAAVKGPGRGTGMREPRAAVTETRKDEW